MTWSTRHSREFPGQQTARRSGALSWLLYTGAGVTTENTVKSYSEIHQCQARVYFPKIDSRFDSDNRSGSGLTGPRRSTIWTDRRPASLIPMFCSTTARTTASLRTTRARSSQPGNASVCAGDIGRLQFSIRRGGATRGLGLALKDAALRSAGPGRGAGPARAAGPGRGAGPEIPITLSRNGKDFARSFGQSEHCARRYRDPCEDRKTGSCHQLERRNAHKDSWVVFELPGFANATSGKQQDSIDASAQAATETSVFQGSGCRLGEIW